MARDPKQLRNNWQRKLGDIVLQLSDDQIKEISKYYNSLDNKESGNIDSRLMMGYNDTVLHEMANKFIEENKTSKLPKIKRKPGRPLKNKKVNLPDVSTSPEALVSALLGIENVDIKDFEKEDISDKTTSIDDVVGENDLSTIVDGITPKYEFDEFVEEVEKKISPEKLFDTQKDEAVKEKTVTVVKDNFDKDKFKSEILKGVENLISELKADKSQFVKILPKNNIVTEYKEVEKIVEVSPEKDENKKLFEGIDNLLQDIRGEEKPQEKSVKKEKKSQTVEKESIIDNIDIALEKIKEYKKLSSSTSTEKVDEEVEPVDKFENPTTIWSDIKYEPLSDVKKDTPSIKPPEEVEPEDEGAFDKLDELLSDVKNDTPSIKPPEEIEPEDEGPFDKLDELLSDVKKDTPSLKPTEEVEPEDEGAYEDLDDLLKDVKKDTPSLKPTEEVEPEDEEAYEDLDDLLSDVKKESVSLKPTDEVEPEDEEAYEDLDDLIKDVRELKRSNEKKEEEVEPEDEEAYEDLDDLIKDVRELKRSNEKKEEEVEPEDESAFEKLDELLTEVRDNTDTLKPRDTDETSDDDYDDEDNKITQIETILIDIKKNIEDSQEEQSQKIENIEILLKEINERQEETNDGDDRDTILQDIENLLIEIREEQNNTDEESDVTESDDEEIADSIDGMNETLEGIDSLLKDILGQEKAEDQKEATEAQKSRQKQEEAEAEKDTKKNVFGALKKIKPPKIPFLDRIKKFFTNIIIGSVVTKLLNWINDPKNKETIDGVLNFVENHMDKILIGLATLVGLNIGMKILSFLKLFVPIAKTLSSILSLIPGAAALGLAGAVAFLATGSSRRTPGQDEQALIRQYAFKTDEEKLEFDRYIQKAVLDDPEYKRTSALVDANPNDPKTEKNFEDTRDRLMGEATLRYFEENPEILKRVALTANERVLDLLPLSDKTKEEIKKLRSNFKELQEDIIKNQKTELELLNKKLFDLINPRTMLPKREEDKGEVERIKTIIEEVKEDYKSQTSEAYTQMSSGYDDLKAGFLPGQRKSSNVSPPSAPQSGSKPEPPTSSPLNKPIPTSTEPTGVKKVIIGAGHAPSPENAAKGLALGSDNLPVLGTADDNFEKNNPDPNYVPTGVTESAATKQVVDALKIMVKERGLEDKIGFKDIYSNKGYDGLEEVPRRVESTTGQQYVDLHFDARQYGKEGVLPSRNESATDKSLMKEFGRYSDTFDPSDKAVTRGGGTLVELGRIDDPKIRGLLEEVKRGEIGPETNKMAERVLRGIVPSIESKPKKDKTQASLPITKDMKAIPEIPSPPSSSIDIAALPMGGMGGNNKKQLSSSSQAGQKGIQVFSPVDLNNMTITSVKSIYNVIA